MTTANGHSGNGATKTKQGPYQQAALGFRNYWYPVMMASKVSEKKPYPQMLLGEEVVFLKRSGHVYALLDECPHRGTRLSRGKDEFPGTNTIACRYHGWVFDVTNGACVAALTDGPDSPMVGKVRARTFPVEEHKGIVWIWMGKGAPVPIEEDVPGLILRDDTKVDTLPGIVEGNWRYHAENVGSGHFPMLHRDAWFRIFQRDMGSSTAFSPTLQVEAPEDGEWLSYVSPARPLWEADFPGLGRWPNFKGKPWRKFSRPTMQPIQGVSTVVSVRLPGITRVVNFPIRKALYYEWYTPIDQDRYIYFQVHCYWPKGILDTISHWFRYRLWGKPMGMGKFNLQDASVIKDSTDFERRHGSNPPSSTYRPDTEQRAWIAYANSHARGEAVIETTLPEPVFAAAAQQPR